MSGHSTYTGKSEESLKEPDPSVRVMNTGLHIKDSRPSVASVAPRNTYLPRVSPDTQRSTNAPDKLKTRVIEAPYRLDPKPLRTRLSDEVRRYGLPQLPNIPGVPDWIPYAGIALASFTTLTYAVKIITKIIYNLFRKKTVGEELAEYYKNQRKVKMSTLDEIMVSEE